MLMFSCFPLQECVAKCRHKFLELIRLHGIIFYAIYVKTMLHVN